MAGKQFPVMETGIYNLTQDTAAALIHFADGQTQQCLLVRLDRSRQQKSGPVIHEPRRIARSRATSDKQRFAARKL